MAEAPLATAAAPSNRPIVVLLVDDQAMVGEAVRRMLAPESDIVFHFVQDPSKAVAVAAEVRPTVILQDLVMPDIDGLTLVKFFRANPGTREVPLIVLSVKEEATVKANAFAVGANDYLVKLPDRIELVARIRHHSKGYISLLERNEAYRALEESQRALAEDVAQAEKYVISLLPKPMRQGSILTDWRFIPSARLGGDAFGYHALDEDHFAFYLIDVCGHGVKAALLSVSVINVLRSQTLPACDFFRPASVLERLNASFPMEQHNGMYFTAGYGVFSRSRREIVYAGGGHPPAALATLAVDHLAIQSLESGGPMVGAFDDMMFAEVTVPVPQNGRLYLYSDGAFEVERPDGTMWTLTEFLAWLGSLPPAESAPLDRLLEHLKTFKGGDNFADDVSLLELRFLGG